MDIKASGSLTYFGSMSDPETVVVHCSGRFLMPYGCSLSRRIYICFGELGSRSLESLGEMMV
jgi:hypothetical protein